MYPKNQKKRIFDIYICLLLIFSCIEIPYRLVLTQGDDDAIWQTINYFIDISFLLDIIFNFNTAYFDEDFKLIDDRKEIAKQYLKSWFIIDLLAIAPLPQPSIISDG